MVTSCCISVRSMLPHPVLRHAGGRLAPASQCCPWRCAACRNTPAALTGARGASCREWSERLEARGCRSTLRRMRAAKAARQATGIVATRSPLLQLCFADQKRPSFAFSPPKFSFLFFLYRRLQLPSCVFFLYYRRVVQVLRGGSVYSCNMCVFSYHWLRVEKERKHVHCVSGVHYIAPSRGGAPQLGETQSADQPSETRVYFKALALRMRAPP